MNLITTGLKSHDANLKLQKLNLIQAKNGAGKSAIARAIEFALLGYCPVLVNKRPSDTAALMSGPEMSVTLTIDAEKTIKRTLRRKGGATYTIEAEASWVRQGTPSEHAEAIIKLAGKETSEAEQNVYVRKLTDSVGGERAKIFDALMSSGKKTPKELALVTARATVQRLADIDDARMPKNYIEALPLLKPGEQAALKALAPMLEAKLSETGIPGAITWAGAEKLTARRSLEGKDKAKTELETRLGSTPEVSDDEIKSLESERSKLEQELGAARQARIAWLDKTARRKELEITLGAAKASLESAKKAGAEHLESPPLDALMEQQAELRAEQDALQPPAKQEDPDIAKLEAEARKLHEEANGIELPVAEAVFKEYGALATAEAQFKEAKESPWVAVLEAVDDIGQSDPEKTLPNYVYTRINDVRKIAKRYLKQPLFFYSEAVTQAKEALNAAKKVFHNNKAKAEKLIHKRNKLLFESEQLQDKANALRDSLNEKNAVAYDDWHTQYQELSKKRLEIEKALAARRTEEESRKKAISEATARVQRIEAELKGVGDAGEEPGDPAQLEAILYAVKSNLGAAYTALAKANELSDIIEEIDTLTATRDVYAAVEWALQFVRSQEMNEAGGPLLAHMEKFLKAAGRKETPYFRASKTDCELGWKDEKGREVAIQVLSGAEWQLFSTALSSAVLAIRKPPLRLLIVEAGEMTAESLDSLCTGILGVQDTLDVAIVLTHTFGKKVPGAWNYIGLNGNP